MGYGSAVPARDFEAIYEEHVWRVYAFFAYRLASRADAEDLTQLTFERALRAFGRYDPSRAAPATWLLAIARNLLVDHVRAQRLRRHEPLPEHLVDESEPELGIEPALQAALAELSERERTLVALRYGGDLTGPEIAALEGLTLANVQQILSRALRKLRARLG